MIGGSMLDVRRDDGVSYDVFGWRSRAVYGGSG